MIFKSILLRLVHFVAGSLGLFLLLMSGTFLLQTQYQLAGQFGVASAVAWVVWAVFSFILRRYDPETVREVALVAYPLNALLALILGSFLGYMLQGMVSDPRRQSWTLIIAGVLLAIVMIVRCLDIRWMRSADDLRQLEEVASHPRRENTPG